VKKKLGGLGRKSGLGFTLVELLVSTAVLLLIMAMLLSMTTQTGNLWRSTTAKIEEFRAARDAFEAMTRRISQATLNTYWDYYPNATAPTSYIRQSDLRFISGPMTTIAPAPVAPRQWPTQGIFFQAPLGFSQDATTYGLADLLNTWGYFIEFNSDAAERPTLVTPALSPLRYRYRLCELMQPTDAFTVYGGTTGLNSGTSRLNSSGGLNASTYVGRDWFSNPLGLSDTSTSPARPVHVLAENVIALVILPKLTALDETEATKQAASTTGKTYDDSSLAPTYLYDSTGTGMPAANLADNVLDPKNQMPAIVEVTMVAISEASSIRLAQTNGTSAPNFGLSSLFTDATKTSIDLNQLELNLTAMHVTYHVFSTNVAIKGAKWSRDETN
jgi:uncharacterized protein (TIGR02599 family)